MPSATRDIDGAQTLPTEVVEEAVLGLTRLWSDARLYSFDHPVIAERLVEVHDKLVEPLTGSGDLMVKRVGRDLVYGSQRLFRRRAKPMGFVGTLDRFGIGCLTIRPGVTEDELRALCTALSGTDAATGTIAAVQEHLEQEHVGHIAVDSLVVPGAGGPALLTRVAPQQLYDAAMEVAWEVAQSAQLGQRIDATAARAVTTEMVAAITQDPAGALALACLRGHDQYTFAHSVHVALLSVALGDFIGMSEDELHGLGLAAMLHDVGKVLVPIEILRKPGVLSQDEWAAMQRHPVDGASMLLDNEQVPAAAPVVAFEHHLRTNLSGYPKLNRPRDLSLPSLIVAMSDVYDALTTHRPYRPPLSPERALDELRGMAGTELDPQLVDWFAEMLGRYPPGSCVALDTGELAVVCGANPNEPERPLVAIVTDPAGRPRETPVDADLADPHDGRHARCIRRPVPSAETGADPSSVIDAWIERHHPTD